MKKIKRKKGERIQSYEFTGLAGIKIMINSHSSVTIFGGPEPDNTTADIISRMITKPDFVFQPLDDLYDSMHFFKSIDGIDYILETKLGYGFVNNELDCTRRRISGFKKYPVSNDTRRVLFKFINVLAPSLKYFSYGANLYPN